ncbi:MAG: protein kinase domain-containing protein [Aureliella sp.]
MTDEALFHLSLGLPDAERRDFVCANASDATQRERVLKLIEAHEQPDSLLETGDMPSTMETSIRVAAGETIGPYKLREQIGEGGMGIVYVAEQEKPVRRRVALKLIKAGMDTRDVTARFEAERQALAMMDHPNIARVLDAGSSDRGRPFFVMELVRGIPINEYCDEKRLTIRQRLKLFNQVCRAIQHAHQKGIIHRDIKPSNVLVTEHDGKPVPKVIDFGVAKAIGQRLTENTIYTHHLQPVGTFLYMSPEQSRLSGLDIDTRSDVYALGLLLYELLTGALPFDVDTFREASFDEKRRIISEDEAPKPSTRVSSLGDTATNVSRRRDTDTRKLACELQGELDWILVKALDKDRNRRYGSPSDFAEDVENYLDGSIVSARPPSTSYQLVKLYTRHRRIFLTTASILAVSLFATIFSVIQWTRAEHARNRLQSVLVDRAITDAMSGNFKLAELTIQQAADAEVAAPLVEALQGISFYFSGQPGVAAERLRKASQEFEDSIEVWGAYFLVSHSVGDYGLMGECRSRVLSIAPSTDSELFFHALVDVYRFPYEARRQLMKLLETNPRSPILNAILAVAERDIVQQEKDFELLESVITRFKDANRLAPGNFYIQTEYMLALVDGIKFARFKGNLEAATRLSADAAELLELLESTEATRAYSRMCRATYYAALQNRPAFEEIESVPPAGLSTLPAYTAARLFENGEYEKDIRSVDRTIEEESQTIVGCFSEIALCASSEQRRQTARDWFKRVTSQRPDYAISSDIIALEAFLFAGDLAELRRQASRLKDKRPDFEWHMYPLVRDLYSDPTEDSIGKLLEFARPFPEETCYAEFSVGMIRLAQGRRAEARLHFESCRKQGKYDWWSHVWATAFLKRLQDPSWPHWIDSREE